MRGNLKKKKISRHKIKCENNGTKRRFSVMKEKKCVEFHFNDFK